MILSKPTYLFYVVRNDEGEFFRRKGFSGGGNSWSKDPKRARVYTEIGKARAVVTWFAKNHPSYAVPEIVIFEAVPVKVIDETDRVAQVKGMEKRAALNKEERKAQQEAVEANERVQAVRRRREACQPDSGRS